MSKRSAGAVRLEQPQPPHPAQRPGDRFTIYADRATGERFRKYCIKYGLTFSSLALAAIAYFIEHCPPPDPPKSLALPRGRRIQTRR